MPVKLVCPRCRTTEGAAPLEAGEPQAGRAWTCPRCGARYPILHDIALLSRDAGALLEHDLEGWLGGGETAPESLDPGLGLALAWLGGERRRRSMGARVLAASAYGDGGAALRGWVRAMLAAHHAAGAGEGLDLGCGAGAAACELSVRLDRAWALDTSGTALRLGRAIACGETRWLDVPALGTVTRRARVDPVEGARPDRIVWLGADAHDPPIEGGAFDVVVALNLVDTVRDPWLVVQQAIAATRSGGLLLVACPFSWRDDLTEADRWLGDDARRSAEDGPAALEGLLAEAGALLDRRELDWSLSHDARATMLRRALALAVRVR